MLRTTLLLLFAVSLAACQTARGTRDGSAWPYPEQPGASSPGAPLPNPGQPSSIPPQTTANIPPEMRPLPSFPRTAEEISGAPVASLIRQAREARGAGKPEQAQSTLERALRIEPRNYFAWSALAATYLDQKNYEQAVSVAGKSNSLARGNIYVELENYRVMQQAREALGDAAGAMQAQIKADDIQRWLEQAQPASITP